MREAVVLKGKLKVAKKTIEDMEHIDRSVQEIRMLQSKLSLTEAHLDAADTQLHHAKRA